MWRTIIDVADQVAAVPDAARAGTRLRALSYAIQRFFYARSGEGGDPPEGWLLAPKETITNPAIALAWQKAESVSGGTTAAAFTNSGALIFERELRKFCDQAFKRPELASVLVACRLVPPELLPASATASATVKSADSETGHFAQRAFSVTLYGLAWSLAMERVSYAESQAAVAAETEGADAETEEDDEGIAAAEDPGEESSVSFGEEDAADDANDEKLRTTFDVARDEIARILFWSMDGAEPSASTSESAATPIKPRKLSERQCREPLRLVAATLLDILLEAVPSTFLHRLAPVMESDGGKPRTHVPIEAGEELSRRIESFLGTLPFQFTLQPLTKPPVYADGARRPAGDGSFQLELVGYRTTNGWLEDFLESADYAGRNQCYVSAVNAQQAVPWSVNPWLYYWARNLADLARPQEWWSESTREVIGAADLDQGRLEELTSWAANEFASPNPDARQRRNIRPGDFLRNPLVASVIEGLRGDEERNRFFLPWKADYRGRIYAETPWFSPQGGDLQRAMLMFCEGRTLDDEGVRALKRHGANLVRRDRILVDLGITDRQVVTLEERERWIDEKDLQIRVSASSPLTTPFWREVASKPLQFLAFCQAYAEWKANPDAPCHLPIQIDGTCNGLQHIAALTGDGSLARAVNVICPPSEPPGDIYSELAEEAVRLLSEGAPSRANAQLVEPAILLLRSIPAWRERLNRAAAKKVVMTIPYGAGEAAQAGYVLEALGELPMSGLSAASEHAIAEIDTAAPALAKKIRAIAGSRFRNLRRAARKSPNKIEALARVARLEAVHASVALAAVMLLRRALAIRYPTVPRFTQWLKQVATRNGGIPLAWVTPIDFPVMQDGFEVKRATLSIQRSRSETIDVGHQRMTDVVDAKRQSNALLPNLIHSLDATHLALTLNAASVAGIRDVGSIHDCLLCHPNDAPRLGKIVRQTFVDLYTPVDGKGELERWYQWMALSGEIASATRISETIGLLGGARLPAVPPEEARRLAESLRGLDGNERRLADMLLRYARTVPPEPPGGVAARSGARRKNHQNSKPIPNPVAKIRPTTPFRLDGVLDSPYFFS